MSISTGNILERFGRTEQDMIINLMGLDHCDAVVAHLKSMGMSGNEIHSAYGIWLHPSGKWTCEIAARDGIKHGLWHYEKETYKEYVEREKGVKI